MVVHPGIGNFTTIPVPDYSVIQILPVLGHAPATFYDRLSKYLGVIELSSNQGKLCYCKTSAN